MKAMKGVIVTIHPTKLQGTIRGEDGVVRGFRRAGMVLWGDFVALQPGCAVLFDEEAGRAINVELPASADIGSNNGRRTSDASNTRH